MFVDEKSIQAQEWESENGIPLVRPTETKQELDDIWKKWRKLSPSKKRLSDQISIELFGMGNENHHSILELMFV